MKSYMMMAGLAFGLSGGALADATNPPVGIGAAEAASHYDQLMTITGVVAQVSLRPTIVFINLDKPYPDSPFVAIIHAQDTNQFSDLHRLKGRSVAITGRVVNYHDHPEIVLTNSSQIVVSGGGMPASTPPPSPPHPAPPPARKAPNSTNDLTTGIM